MFKKPLEFKLKEKLKKIQKNEHHRFLKKFFSFLDQKHHKHLKRVLKKIGVWKDIQKITSATKEMMYYTQGYTIENKNLIIEYGTRSVSTGLPNVDYVLEEYFNIKATDENFIFLKGFFSIPQYQELLLLYHYFYSLHSYPDLAI